MIVPAYTLNNTQVRALHALLEEDGLTGKELAARLGVKRVDMGGSSRHGPSRDPNSLYALGYVTPQVERELGKGEEVRYWLTEAGVSAARTHRVMEIPPVEIPADVLDPVVIAFRPSRSYGMDDYTEDDWVLLRSRLPEGYQDVPLGSLRNRAINRRKVGAYKEVKLLKCWICGSIDDLGSYDTNGKRRMILCESCHERNEPYMD